MDVLCLNEGWKLLEAPLSWGPEALTRVLASEGGWMDAKLPCDVRMPLIASGVIRDPVKADYSFESEWIERRSWWFVKRFSGQDIDRDADAVELTLDGLDALADVFLNGEHLGTHRSAHYPFTAGIKGRVLPGENVLAARLTTGLEQVSEEDLAQLNWAVCHEESNGCPQRGDRRRAYVRKPAYSIGWDWGPKAPTCGITREAFLKTYNNTAIRRAHLTSRLTQGGARIRAQLTIDQLHPYKTRDAAVEVRLMMGGALAARATLDDVLLTSGVNYVDLSFDLPGAKLWWPNGYGDQPLYDVDVRVACGGETERYPSFRFGVREFALDTGRVDEKARRFQLSVNGVPVFCKGGDWIPADSVYARVTKEKYRALIDEAVAANFNMLRVWGGGVYERDEFFDACDERGILLWHDFMFACSTYPDHLDWFQREAEREIDWQTKRLSGRACLALFCGNNENHWIFNPEDNPAWKIDLTNEKQYGLYISNHIAPAIVRKNCPEIPYWNSSPYGGEKPNSDFCGDVHHWHACMMNPEMAKRIDPKEYDKVNARFVTEYGYPGPCPIESIREYFDGAPIDRLSRVWDLHNNTFEKRTVAAGIEKHYLDGAARLDLPDYLLYAGMTQGLMLGYSLEAIRFKLSCAGALFWMYNDTWGEVGWTIVDYYLRRKISFYGVKRAFAPVKLTLREENGEARLIAANDTPSEIPLVIQLGYLPFDGGAPELEELRVTLAPRSRALIATRKLPDADYARGAFVALPSADCASSSFAALPGADCASGSFAALPDADCASGSFVALPDADCAKAASAALPDGGIDPAVLRRGDLRDFQVPGSQPRVVSQARDGEDLVVTLTADGFVHGAHLAVENRMSDNYFDLVPGQVKTVRVSGGAGLTPEWKTVPFFPREG